MIGRTLCAVVAALAAVVASAQTTVMRVNGVDVARNEYEAAKRVLAMQFGGAKVDSSMLEKGAVEQIVGRILLVQAARDAKVSLEPGEVAKALEEQKKQSGGQEQFVQGLAEVGLTEKDVERVMGETMLVHKYVQTHLAPQVTVPDEEAKKFYDEHPDEFKRPEEVKLRMILVEVKPGADEATDGAAKAKAEKALERIKKGEDFAKVAADTSDDPTKMQGGEVGWVPRGRLLHDIEPAVFALQNGQMSEVLKTRYGYNVFKVEDRHAPRTASLDEVKVDLLRGLKNRQIQTRVRDEVMALKSKAKIEILDPAVKAAYEAPVKPAGVPEGARPAAGPTK